MLVHQFTMLRPRKKKCFTWYLTNLSEFYSTQHEKVIIFGDFNKDTENRIIKDVLQEHAFYRMMKKKICF